MKIIRLKVAGAFHTKHMRPAQESLHAKAAEIDRCGTRRTGCCPMRTVRS